MRRLPFSTLFHLHPTGLSPALRRSSTKTTFRHFGIGFSFSARRIIHSDLNRAVPWSRKFLNIGKVSQKQDRPLRTQLKASLGWAKSPRMNS